MSEADLQDAFKKFLEQNRDLIGVTKPGRPKGSKNKPISEVKPEEIQQITLTKGQEKAILKQRRKPRVLSEEQKEQMLRNLALGRQKLTELRQAGVPVKQQRTIEKEKAKEEALKTSKIIPVKVKEYKKGTKPIQPEPETEESDSEDEIPIRKPIKKKAPVIETESETEPELRKVRKNVEKKKQTVELIDKTLQGLEKPKGRFSHVFDNW